MTAETSRRVIVAGAGVAGLTAGLALDARNHSVTIVERSPVLAEVGAGLQLSPNATRLLGRLGVLERLLPRAVAPEALELRSGRSDRTLLRLPLGKAAEQRWGAPYLVCHRADLQEALLEEARSRSGVALNLGCEIAASRESVDGIDVDVTGDYPGPHAADVLVAADGVWSQTAAEGTGRRAEFSGYVAWRTTIHADDMPDRLAQAYLRAPCVRAWLGPTGHLIAYPVKSGRALNLVAVTPGRSPGESWSVEGDPKLLATHFSGWDKAITGLLNLAGKVTYWPLFGMADGPWLSGRRTVLIGDAAHAMTPFAAQGAAMAIEDACALAAKLGAATGDPSAALAAFEAQRKPRVEAARRRGALNRFAYHAAGPVALVRDTLFRLRSAESFAADLDWLYRYDGTGFAD